MKSFVTGSHAYGNPTAQSDVDLVVRVDYHTASLLRSLSDTPKENNGTVVVRFGKLNLILAQDDDEFACWRLATSEMEIRRRENGETFSKEQAKPIFDSLRERLNIQDHHDSGGP